MFQLHVLGGLSLTGPGGHPVAGGAAQRHRLALLALLALRGPGPVSRDKLLGLLWPERDTRSARRLLNLAVHALRRALGPSAIRSAGDGLALDPCLVTTDAARLAASAAAGDLAGAAALYRGPLLDGFFLPDAAEFDRWADQLRVELAARHAGLLEALAAGQEAAGAWQVAAEWWRRLAALDPGNGRVVRRLMLALDAGNDRAGALAQARAHARFMSSEFGTGPDPAVAAAARTLTRRVSAAHATASDREQRPLAVLPFAAAGFADLDGSFGSGLAFELRHRLAAAGVRVAGDARGSPPAPGLSALEIGAALGVAGVVSGSVRRLGERIRVTATLVETAHGLLLWSGVSERRAGDPVRAQEELAVEMARGLAAEWATGPLNGLDLDARGLILRGRFALGRRSADGLQTAVRYFSAALSRDPAHPGAFSGLADAYAVMGFYDQLPPDEAFGASRRAARQALRLDRRLAAARATLAYLDLYHRWNLPLAEARFRSAIAGDPRNGLAHQWYGNLLAAAGRGEESIREMSRAVALDPQSLVAGAATGWAMYHAGQPERAVEQCGTTLELDPNFAPAHLWQGLALQELERWEQAIEALERARGLLQQGAHATAALARALAAAGDRTRAEALLAEVEGSGGYRPSYGIAKVWLALGRREEALAWLERAARERAHAIVFLRVDPQLAPLRGDPRFGRLLGLVAQ